LLLAAVAAGAGVADAPAHEIPRDVTVRAFVRPEGNRLLLIVRVPLEAMRDIEFPLRGAGFLDLAAADPHLRHAAEQWLGASVRLYQDRAYLGPGRLAAVRVSLPTDRSFGSSDEALRHVLGQPLGPETDLPWQQALLDAVFEYPITSDHARFSIAPAWAHLGLETLLILTFAPPAGAERVYQLRGDPGLVRLDPRWHQAAARFVELGFRHILDGVDHLLFLLCLIIPVRSVPALVPVVTAFTVAHSITLIGAALGLAPEALWFPPLVETLIAASVLFMAIGNALGVRPDHHWKLAFGFGLIHGFGFSFALADSLQFAGRHLVSSLFAFNVGVELGQLAVIVVAAPLVALLYRRVAPRPTTIVLSVVVGHTAWHWMADRFGQFRQFDLRWPAVGAAQTADLLRWGTLLAVAATAAWLLALVFGRIDGRLPRVFGIVPGSDALRPRPGRAISSRPGEIPSTERQ
jgi:hypothetical protein